MPLKRTFILLTLLFLAACTRSSARAPLWTPVAVENVSLPVPAPVQTYLPPTRAPGQPIHTPTPNIPDLLPTFTPLAPNDTFATPTLGPLTHTVQAGDYPGAIAAQYNISLAELLKANNLTEFDIIYPGQALIIPGFDNSQASPAPQIAPDQVADYFKIIPDSELVYGPLATIFDLDAFIRQKGGYLAYYSQDVGGETLSGAQVIRRVADNYSVNPRILLAVLEYRAQWLTNPNPAASTLESPIVFLDASRVGLYRQLAWTANRLNEGYYRWGEGSLARYTLSDGSAITPQPGINPGTAAIQHFFAAMSDTSTWRRDVGPNGFYATYSDLFGYPFDWAIEPFLPRNLTQPAFILPFEPGQVWQFTGGPHGGWDGGSAWAALDFAPPGQPNGCAQNESWVTALADGRIVRSLDGQVAQDLDGDGLEQTGWVILYAHIESRGRVRVGDFVRAGERIGHPSCEGGFSNATHLHLARKFNGMWIAATDPSLPFVMDGWTPTVGWKEYDGRLVRNGQVVEAWEFVTPLNEISR